uniref:Uncharacterized protein n=1 Tax=Arundo donax TaxID=35708 RepID=A0A0A9B818_ARUDO
MEMKISLQPLCQQRQDPKGSLERKHAKEMIIIYESIMIFK